jgi:arylsulfatase A-like enzyme
MPLTLSSRAGLALALLTAGALPAGEAARAPNVIIILADDLGRADLGATGVRDLSTPNIDSLARNGASLTNAYITAPVCLPSRMGLITGRQQERFGVQTLAGPTHVGKVGLPHGEATLGDRLRAVGYRTAIIGKWHMGEREPHLPNARGFDEFFGFLGGSLAYLPEKPGVVWRNETRVQKREYLTDQFGREAVEFIDRNHDRPFFLYLCFNAPHTPLQATDEYLKRHAHIAEPGRRYYAAMVSAMDDNVGRVIEALRRHGLDENTLIIFLSDNGGAPQNWSDNAPLRSGKYELYEGGIRTPFLVQWPGGGIGAGTTSDALASALDIVPTVLAAAGARPGPAGVFDGENLLPLLRGQTPRLQRERLHWRYGPHMAALREGPWKLVKVGVGQEKNPSWELYDLERDPGETQDLAARLPEKVAELTARFEQWDATLPAPLFVDQRLLDGVIWWRDRALPEN